MGEQTIAAISTALGSSGIGIVRISGERAVEVADRVFRSPSGKRLADCPSHTIHYGRGIGHADARSSQLYYGGYGRI